MAVPIFDIIIIGGGPAGLSAGIYACRGRMKTLLLEKLACGGQTVVADIIENFPGFARGIKGVEFIGELEKQATGFGLEIKEGEEVVEIAQSSNGPKIVRTQNKEYRAWAVIVAAGARPRALGVPGEDRLLGKGVSYCATCDGPLFRDKDVIVVGGGDTAVGEALFLARFCRQVSLVHRRDKLRATKILQERAFASPNLKFFWNSIVTEILGRDRVERVRIQNVNTGREKALDVRGVFVFVGLKPQTDFLKTLMDVDNEGFVITDEEMKTSQEGIFACGDCRKKTLRQIVTACAEGAIAGFIAMKFVEGIEKN